MNTTALRTAALWTTIASGVMTLACSGGFQLIVWMGAWDFGGGRGVMPLYSLVAGASLLLNVIHTLALLLFLGLVHRDLHIAERWAGYARDYLIRDTTGAAPSSNPPETEVWRP